MDITGKYLIMACLVISFLFGLLIGGSFYQNIKNAILPMEKIAMTVEHKLILAEVGEPVFDGNKTSITHRFKGKPNQIYSIQYTPDLISGWENGEKHHTTEDGDFHVTIDKPGDHSSEWNKSMFFRINNVEQEKTTL